MKEINFPFLRPDFLSGAASLFDFCGTLRNSFPIERDADARALEADWQAIGDDWRAILGDWSGKGGAKMTKKLSRARKLDKAHQATLLAFPSYEAAIRWMRAPNPVFSGLSPLDVLDTDDGLDKVLAELERLKADFTRMRMRDDPERS